MTTSAFDQAKAFFLEGLARYQAGDFAAAEQRFAAALALAPGRASVLTNLGATRLKLGKVAEAEADLAQALRQDPDNVEALGHYAAALAQSHQLPDAVAAFDRALSLQPTQAALWLLRGTALRELGRTDDAVTSFRRSLALGGDESLNRFYLAALGAGAVPAAPPRAYVEALFDQYASEFDHHLVDALRYRAPALLCERLPARRFARALDLGCGTGLCGPHLRRVADRVDGVDVSTRMLDQAQRRHAYDALVQADALAYLHAVAEPFDLVLAADVFEYLGALPPVLDALHAALAARGVAAFTLEESATADLALGPSLRYAHSEASLRREAQARGFRLLALERHPIREEQGAPVPGLYAWLQKDG